MKRKKILKYLKRFFIGFAILTIVLLIGVSIYMNHLGKQIYGGLTERVDFEQFKPQKSSFAIKHVNLLSEDGEQMIQNQTILIEDGHISAIDSTLTLSSEIVILDGKGKYLIPGLIDAHVHLFQSKNDLLLYMANGVTEIRELIGEEDHLEWRKEINNGMVGPKMFIASPRIGSFEFLEGWMMEYTQGYVNLMNAEEAREAVQDFHDEGYDAIKIYSQVNKETYIAISETAETLNMPIYGHVPWALGFEDVWKFGQSDIVHFEELMNALGREFDDSKVIGGYYGKEDQFLQFVEKRSEALAQNLIANDLSVTSSLWLTSSIYRQAFEIEKMLKEVELEYENPGISEWSKYIPGGLGWLPEVQRFKQPEEQSLEKRKGSKNFWTVYGKASQLLAKNMADSGVKIMAGTDANLPPVVPGFSLHNELLSLKQHTNMTNAQLLKSATTTPAEFLNSNTGKIKIGYEANLVLLDKNPLENIANTKSINTVISMGNVFDRALLDKMLAAVKAANDNSRTVNIDEYKKK